jgi:hypothetical protein
MRNAPKSGIVIVDWAWIAVLAAKMVSAVATIRIQQKRRGGFALISGCTGSVLNQNPELLAPF